MRQASIFCSVAALFLFVSPIRARGFTLFDRGQPTTPSDTLPDTLSVWVYFTDKGTLLNYSPSTVVSSRSIVRRLKVKPDSAVIDFTDLPVNEHYVRSVGYYVLQIRHRSRWFNGVSVVVLKEKVRDILAMPFVREVEVLRRYGTVQNLGKERSQGIDGLYPAVTGSLDSLDYGLSFEQLQQINVPTVHNDGNYGQGVLVGIFDNGFNLLSHEALAHLDIVATYDFAESKVSPVPTDGSGSHGTMTLSTLAGYKPGKLIGPAFRASFVLARTEVAATETPLEEDNWVAAIEWADSIGVDIVSTSLAYCDFDLPFKDCTREEMDGNTTLITRAADMAVSKGIVVVVSAGNEGMFEIDSDGNLLRDSKGDIVWVGYNTLWEPADGDSVISVGAVDWRGERVYFSSFGPTLSNPPRIKPDVMAMGTEVYVANAESSQHYRLVAGTSFSCPLVAGVAALVLAAHSEATPMQIIEALKMTASRAQNPDRFYGWGIVNAEAAIRYLR